MHEATNQQITTPDFFSEIFAAFLRSLQEIFAPPVVVGRVQDNDRLRREAAAAEQAEQIIASRYADAWYRHHEIAARAAAHGVQFSLSATDAHKLAILDFLDNPLASTPLTHVHTTWFWGVTHDGRGTTSCSHPVGRAIYAWNALDIARRPRTGDPFEDATVDRLRTHYPSERVAWSEAQWRLFETLPSQTQIEIGAARPALSARAVRRDGVPSIV